MLKQFPWAYITPVKGYFKLLKIIAKCPEIADLIHRRSAQTLLSYLLIFIYLPIIIPLVALFLLSAVIQWLEQKATDTQVGGPIRRVRRRCEQLVYEAHQVMPPHKIRERLNETAH